MINHPMLRITLAAIVVDVLTVYTIASTAFALVLKLGAVFPLNFQYELKVGT